MATESLDLRNLLEQDRLQVMDLLDVSRKLVLDVRASHYWTQQGLESFQQLSNIATNLDKLLGALAPHWGEGKKVFNREEAVKLWKTGAGLYRALPPIRARFADQLDKRRRQRIMGESYEELPDLLPEDIEADRSRFTVQHLELRRTFESLQARIAEIPDQLVPILDVKLPPANGQGVAAKEGAKVDDVAVPAPPPPAQPVSETSEPAEEQG